MAKCATCGTWILFGGQRAGDHRFCNADCAANAFVLHREASIPEDAVLAGVNAIHQGDCPRCAGPGPVDIHVKHEVYSLLVFTKWKSLPMLCCRGCATKGQIGSAAFSMLAGWWGIPWGFLLTPVQIARNIGGIANGPRPDEPSQELYRHVRSMLAIEQVAAEYREIE